MKNAKTLLLMLLMVVMSMGVKAQETQNGQESQEVKEPQEVQNVQEAPKVVVTGTGDYTGGTIVVNEEKSSGQTVVITVTPAPGYYIAKKDIEVIPARDPSLATRTEGESTAPAIDQKPLTLTLVVADDEEQKDDVDDLTAQREYSFTVPEGLGAWITKADFHEVDKPVTSGKIDGSDVSWEVTGEAENTSLTLDGEGTAILGETAPWEAFKGRIVSLTVGEDVQELGDGLLAGLSSLKTITLKGSKIVGLGQNTLSKAVTVDVAGQLYNEYKASDDWGQATIASTGGTQMTGVAFGTNNDYDTFVSSEALQVPSMLTAYTVTGVDGSRVVLDEVKVIPAGVPVLLFSKGLDDSDFITAKAADQGGDITVKKQTGGTTYSLQVAPEGGQPVGLGEVYLLYNDVFYLSQAGRIPAGGIYLQPAKEQLSKTRSMLVIDGTGTTAIDAPVTFASQRPDAWYTLDGRRLSGKPSQKGVYINGGVKVVIK